MCLGLNGTNQSTVLCLYWCKKKDAKEQWDKLLSEKALWEERNMFSARKKDYLGGVTCWSSSSPLTCVIALWSTVLIFAFGDLIHFIQ